MSDSSIQPFGTEDDRRSGVRSTEDRDRYRDRIARVTLDSMVQFVGLLDHQGFVVEINKVALDAVGIQLSEVQGKPFWTTFWWQVSEEINQTLRDSIRRAASGEFVRWDTPIYGRAGGKETIIIDASLMPVKDDEGRVVYITAEGRDITEKKAHEREIARQREELAKLDVLKTQFFANISHEFRTPLTLMLGPLEDALANTYGPLPLEAAASLTLSHRNALRLLKLVNTMLDFSRIEAGRIEASYQAVDLAALTTELASNFRSLCEKAGLRLIVNCASFEAAYVDTGMWEKIVLNLLSNAFKFTLEGEIEVRLEAAGGQARLAVRDTGVGIPSEELPRMFERFHRIERNLGRTHEGTGIGLALVHELVRLHGGSVAVESVPGQGSTFLVSIPLGKDHLDPSHISRAPELPSTATTPAAFVEEALRWLPQDVDTPEPAPAAPSGATVLIADDNADMRDYLHKLLTPEYVVEVVANGEEALHAIERGRLPDLVITDVMMPVMDGFELVRRLRAVDSTRTLPIIMLSARAGEEARVGGLDAGADDYLVKPFTARELTAKVRSQIAMAHSRRDAELRLRTAQERLALALEASSLGAWDLYPATGTLTTDARHKEIFGFPANSEVTLAMAVNRVHPEDRERVQDEVDDLLRSSRERHYQSKFRLLWPGGTVKWIAANGRAIVSTEAAGNASLRLVGTARDVTDERQTEQSLRETQKLESLGLLAGGIAHDFNNLLTGVIGNASLLADEFDADSPQAAIVQSLRDAAERMTRLTSQMLAYSGRGHSAIESVDLSQQVVQITSLVQASIPKNVQLRLSLANDLPRIDADIGQLQQIVMNLVINAAEAVGAGDGFVELTTGVQQITEQQLAANVTRQSATPGKYVVLSVADTGCGMDEATRARIFDPFFTTKFTGRGLGLSSVLGIVRGHRGVLTVDSEPDAGTVFRVFFPASGRPQQPAVVDESGIRGEGAILVVDDEDIVRRLAETSLKRLGYRVFTASNGLEALSIFAPAPDAIDAVLLDMTMPVMGGEETLRRLLEIKPSVVVVAMSGFDEREAKLRFGNGLAAFLHKPFTAGQLGAKIGAARWSKPLGLS